MARLLKLQIANDNHAKQSSKMRCWVFDAQSVPSRLSAFSEAQDLPRDLQGFLQLYACCLALLNLLRQQIRIFCLLPLAHNKCDVMVGLDRSSLWSIQQLQVSQQNSYASRYYYNLAGVESWHCNETEEHMLQFWIVHVACIQHKGAYVWSPPTSHLHNCCSCTPWLIIQCSDLKEGRVAHT